MIRKLFLTAIAGSLVLGLSACNTVAGAGKDLQSASESTKEAINK
ncbi:Entericidin EcnA/B family protein [Novosphingobium sp.]|nr:Entericidin EcnA/B family protein [Novosphingobium sp.]